MLKKKIAAVALAFMVGLAFLMNPSPASARWSYIINADHNLSISSSGIANIYAYTRGITGVSEVKAEAQLQQYKNSKWTTISPSWTASSTTKTYVTLTKTYAVKKGYQYRLVTVHKATNNGDTESVTQVGNAISY